METLELSIEDRRSGRWLEVGRTERRLEIRAGAGRRNRLLPVGAAARRVPTTVWEITATPDGPAVHLLEPTRRSALTRLGGMVADLEALLRVSGAPDDPVDEMAAITEATRSVLAQECGRPSGRQDLLGLLTKSAFPLLAASMRLGALPPRSVPSPVAPYLRAHSAREAARRAFGRRATRPVVRALGETLAAEPDRPPALEPLSTAVLGTTVLPPERIEELLRARPAQPGAVMLAMREVGTGQELLGRLHPTVAYRLLVEVLESAAGAGTLIELLAWWDAVGRPDPPRGARSLRELRDAMAQLPVVLTARARKARPPARQRAEVHPPRPAPRDPYPADLRALDGARVGAFVIDVPRGGLAVVRWGQSMANCLGAYRDAVDSGESLILGYRRVGVLSYAVELSPQRWIRQFEAVGGQPPDQADVRLILDHLGEVGALHLDARRHRPGRRLAPPV